MSHASGYDLYNHPEGVSFRAVWDHALSLGVQRLKDGAMKRAIHGVPSPIFYKGEQVGERRLFNDHLVGLLLCHHVPAFGGQPGLGRPSTRVIEHQPTEQAEGPAEAGQEACDRLLRFYANECCAERGNRLAGWIVAADFYLRQRLGIGLPFEGFGDLANVVECWKSLLVYDKAVAAPMSPFHDNIEALHECA